MKKDFNKRRIFFTDGVEHYQIFTFEQNKNDQSIYVSTPTFSKSKWLIRKASHVSIVNSPGEGKLSLHASGQSHVRANDAFIIQGHYLVSPNKNLAGVRQLFSIFMDKPELLPPSPVFNRRSDCSINMQQVAPLR